MGKKARDFVSRELNSDVHYRQLIEIYEQAARRRVES
jgi:hypothetical protein